MSESVTFDKGIVSRFRDFAEERRPEFWRRGYNRKRPFFPHRIYYVPRCGPDALKLARRMSGIEDPDALWEVLLFATGPVLGEFAEELYFDDDLVWHQQQFGRPGHIAFAYLAVKGQELYGLNYVSDLVQRQSRRPECKTRIEKTFRGWQHILFNGMMTFAVEQKLERFYSPTADFAIAHTDRSRTVQRELFERVYDRAVSRQWLAGRDGDWWVIDVAQNSGRVLLGEKREELIESGKTICVCHDIERGRGHAETDPGFAALADHISADNLELMLAIEEEMEVKATYHVLGCLLSDVREKIEQRGHCIAFHSYDHDLEREQLAACRKVDYRIKGYRPPRSRITPELTDETLCFRNFEWLASSARSIGTRTPKIENGIVKIPILFDDSDLYKRRLTYEEWERRALAIIEQHDFVAFGLHDCYGRYWLHAYRDFLKRIRGLGTLKTLNEVAGELILGSAV